MSLSERPKFIQILQRNDTKINDDVAHCLWVQKAGIKQRGRKSLRKCPNIDITPWSTEVLSSIPGMLCWLRVKFLTDLIRTSLTLDTGSRWLPVPSESAPIHQQGKESIWFHLSLLWSGTSCLLSLTKTVLHMSASRTCTARAAGLYFSQPSCACLPTPLSWWTACCFSSQPLLRCTTSLEKGL